VEWVLFVQWVQSCIALRSFYFFLIVAIMRAFVVLRRFWADHEQPVTRQALGWSNFIPEVDDNGAHITPRSFNSRNIMLLRRFQSPRGEQLCSQCAKLISTSNPKLQIIMS
jgi:hypothetical protein